MASIPHPPTWLSGGEFRLSQCALPAPTILQPGDGPFPRLQIRSTKSYALARVAQADSPVGTPIGIVHGVDPTQVALARAIADRFAGTKVATFDLNVSGNVEEAQDLREAATIVMLGPAGRMKGWLSALAGRDRLPRVIVPGALADPDIVDAPRTWDGRIAVAFPIDPTDRSAEMTGSYRRTKPSVAAGRST